MKMLTAVLGVGMAVLATAADFSLAEFGAKADGSDCSAAIARAVAACATGGGGRVIVPPGVWRTGRVELKSNVELHLEPGAELRFVDDPQAYLPAVLTSFEGIECYNYSPLIYAFGMTNIAVTGEGRLVAEMDTWRRWGGRRKPAG